MWNEEPSGKSGRASNLARLMSLIAQHWAFRPREEVQRIKAAEAKFRPPKQGMTDRNRAKLRALMDPQKLQSLISLPFAVVKEIDPDHPTVSDAVLVQSALAVALLLIAPMREKNLASLDIDRHLHRVSEKVGYVVIPRHEVKNERDLECPLSRRVLGILDLDLGAYRPLLLKGAWSSSFSFPGTAAKRRRSSLECRFPNSSAIPSASTSPFTCFGISPGTCSSKSIRASTSQFGSCWDKDLATTIAFYTALEHADSFRRYDEILERHREEDSADA